LVGKHEEKQNLEELSVGGRIVWKWIVKKLDGRMWTGLVLLRKGTHGEILNMLLKLWASALLWGAQLVLVCCSSRVKLPGHKPDHSHSSFEKARNAYSNVSIPKYSWRNHDNPTHRLHNHTLYDIPPIPFVIQVTQKDLRRSLMMADYCRNT
jgi:hypothetical protein